jgi:hypothetical protein
MTNTKITKRDRYNETIEILTAAGAGVELIEFHKNEIALLDKKAAKAKETAAAKKTEADALQVAVQEALTGVPAGDYVTIADVTAMVANGDEDITPAKVSYRLGQLVKAGVAESTDVKIAGGEGTKARTVKGYRICVTD